MVNVPILSARQIMKDAKSAIGHFVKCFRNGLFTTQSKPNVPCLFPSPESP
jgi:hypothetical protein